MRTAYMQLLTTDLEIISALILEYYKHRNFSVVKLYWIHFSKHMKSANTLTSVLKQEKWRRKSIQMTFYSWSCLLLYN